MLKFSIAQFVREVRQEVTKVSWPSRKETITTSLMVLFITLLSSLFFFLSDTVISSMLRLVFKYSV